MSSVDYWAACFDLVLGFSSCWLEAVKKLQETDLKVPNFKADSISVF